MKGKIIKGWILALTIICASSSTVCGATVKDMGKIDTYDQMIAPCMLETNKVYLNYSLNGNVITAKTSVVAQMATASIRGTLSVEKFINGSWIMVASWSLQSEGYASCSKNYTGVSGAQYRVRVTVNINGEIVDATSNTCTL